MTASVSTVHFDLSPWGSVEGARLEAGATALPLRRHDPATRRAAAATAPLLGRIPGQSLTHYAELPASAGDGPVLLRLLVGDRLLLTAVHLPRQARGALLPPGRSVADHPKLAALGIDPGDDGGVLPDVHDYKTALDAATSLLFHHPQLMVRDPEAMAAVLGIIEYANGISDLASAILQQASQHAKDPAKPDWVLSSPMTTPGGEPVLAPDGEPVQRYSPSPETCDWIPGPLADSLAQAAADPRLEGVCWSVQQGSVCAAASGDGARPPLPPRFGVTPSGLRYGDGGEEVSLTLANAYRRWLALFVTFEDKGGEPLVPEGWSSRLPPELAAIYETPTTKYLASLPFPAVMLTPPQPPSQAELTVSLPAAARAARLSCAGLGGSGWQPRFDAAGVMPSAVFDQAVTVAGLASGAPVTPASLAQVESQALDEVLRMGEALARGPLADALRQADSAAPALDFLARYLGALVLTADAPQLTAWLTATFGEAGTYAAATIFGWPAEMLGLTADAAALARRRVPVLASPATTELLLALPTRLEVELLPDPADGNWPAAAGRWRLEAVTCSERFTAEGELTTVSDPVVAALDGVSAAGELELLLTVETTGGRQAGSGRAATALPAPGPAVARRRLVLEEKMPPIDAASRYRFRDSLIYADGEHRWQRGAAPTATVKDLDPSNVGHNLARLVGVTVSQSTGTLGYAWQASGQDLPMAGGSQPDPGQMFTFQNIAVGSRPQEALQLTPFGFPASAQLAYPLHGAADGPNLLCDPRGTLHDLRPVILDGTAPFAPDSGLSRGRLHNLPDGIVVTPSGLAAAVNRKNGTLEVVQLATRPVADAEAPVAAIFAGGGRRPGLLDQPVAVASSPRGALLVLEAGSGRIQAFDPQGNPLPIFAGGEPTLALRGEGESVTYLDLAIGPEGYLYVLKYLGKGALPADYRLDLYQSDGLFVCQTPGVAAARQTVGAWRTVYTLDYQALAGPGERTEPSVSRWALDAG